MRAAGMKAEMHNGTKVWCKTETPTGSRIASGPKTCATAAEWDANAAATQDRLKQQLNQQLNPQGR
jgi:hypothetical protein